MHADLQSRVSPLCMETSSEVSLRIRCARNWCHAHRNLLFDPMLRTKVKYQLYKSFVRPILTYGSELWTLDSHNKKRLRSFEYSILLEIYKVKYPPKDPERLKISLREVFAKYKGTDIVNHLIFERPTWDDISSIEHKVLEQSSKNKKKDVHWWDSVRRNRGCSSRKLHKLEETM